MFSIWVTGENNNWLDILVIIAVMDRDLTNMIEGKKIELDL